MKEFYELITHSGPIGILVAIVFSASILSKALFAWKRSIGQDRKEFLEFWSLQKDKPDDLWLEVAVRHFFGTYLPASLIRRIVKRHHPARVLLDLCASWDYFRFDQGSHTVKWKRPRHEKAMNRTIEVWFFRMLSIFFFVIAYIYLNPLFTDKFSGNAFTQGAWVFNFTSFCLAAFVHAQSLSEASKESPQWLELD